MVGELIQGITNEIRDEHDASDPLTTLGRFVGKGFELGALNETLEIAGDMGGGLAGILPEVDVQPQLDNTLNASLDTTIDPMFANGPSFNNNFT